MTESQILSQIAENLYQIQQTLEKIHQEGIGVFQEPALSVRVAEEDGKVLSPEAEALEEVRDGKPLVYFEYSRGVRHVGVPLPEIFMEGGEAFYDRNVEVDKQRFAEEFLSGGGEEVTLKEAGLYKKDDGRWYGMEEHRAPFTFAEWAARGAFDKKPEGVLVEIADSIIRNLHMMHSLLEGPKPASLDGLTVSDIIRMKVEYNDTRPHKHGKKF